MEALAILVQQNGLRGAADITSIPFGTLAAWQSRGKFNAYRTHTPMPIAEANQNALAGHRERSAVHLAKYAEESGKRLADSKGNLDHAQAFRQIASGRASLFPEQQGNTNVTVNVLGFAAVRVEQPEET